MRLLVLTLIGLWMAAAAFGQVVPDTLRPPPAVADSLMAFGWTVDADDDFLLVGAWEVRPNALQSDPKGTAFVYRLTDDGLVLDGRLLSDRLYIQDCFSLGGLDVRDSVAAVGAYCELDGTSYGAVYLYRRDANGWRREAKIRAEDVVGVQPPGLFGYALALGDGFLVVGGASTSSPADSTDTQSGIVLIYERNGSAWVQTQVLVSAEDDALRNERFGSAVALVGEPGAEALLVVAEQEVGPDPSVRGVVYVFERSGGVWMQQAKLYCDGQSGAPPSSCGTRLRAGGGGAVVASDRALQPLDRVGGAWQLGAPLPTPGDGFPIGVDRYGDEILAVGSPTSGGAPTLVYTQDAGGTWTATP